jgi:hypothetical protein
MGHYRWKPLRGESIGAVDSNSKIKNNNQINHPTLNSQKTRVEDGAPNRS